MSQSIMYHPDSLKDRRLARAEGIISYYFSNPVVLREALQLADASHQIGNRNLALLGNTVIHLILVQEGLRRRATRGQINKIISERSSNAYLAQQGFSNDLAECVFANQSQGSTIYPRPMASTVEAIIGAVFNDSTEELTTVKRVMETLGVSWPE
ncbi:putative RNAse III [Aspergillus campestris IBT 28561]|uniref:RNAse III n=1 Tax=Aspergillus campestris (strain IBT 28561) TaxID=1392248 RepID=A0A2I1CVQ7_ASPC2|nr:putative RNAse III [Aspergillus campestris IBT 28561]PKY01684.1 putative RNAse III [Aspergillus campestris IBT 28561]